MDIFDKKLVKPMLIKDQSEAFDSIDYIFEIKFDGIRCIAYLDSNETDLRNKRNKKMVPHTPELSGIHKQLKDRCILDGELFVFKNGVTDFYEIQRRALLTDPFKIKLAADKYPACFVAYDILYYKDREITNRPLMERKKYLEEMVMENSFISVSRFVENNGIMLFNLVKEKGLEGIVAKRKDSLYWEGKRSKDWIKCKVMNTNDCVICGYIPGDKSMASLVIGQYDDGRLVYKGHVSLGVSLRVLNQYKYNVIDHSPFGHTPAGNDSTVWLEPELICVIESMPTENGVFRLPVFRGIKN